MDAIMFKVTTAPKSATKVPADTSVFVPVLPEAVPMFAQVLKPAFLEDATTGLRRKSCFKVPDVVVAPQQATGGSQRVQISQVSNLRSFSLFSMFLVCFLCVCAVIEDMGHFQGPAWLCPFIRYGLRPTGGEFIFHIISRRNKFTLYQEFNSRFNLQVNGHSFSAFANTISFNVSRYPTLSEVPCRSQILLGFQ